MSKTRKKRNKAYRGEDARDYNQRPTLHRYIAPMRGPLAEWWHEHKQAAKIIGVVLAGLGLVAILLIELVRIVFH